MTSGEIRILSVFKEDIGRFHNHWGDFERLNIGWVSHVSGGLS